MDKECSLQMWWREQTRMRGGLLMEMSNKGASLQTFGHCFGLHLDFKEIINVLVNMGKTNLHMGAWRICPRLA